MGRGTHRGMEKGEWCAGEGVHGEVVKAVDGVCSMILAMQQ